MVFANSHALLFAFFLGDGEVVLIAVMLLILLGARKLPGIMRGFGHGLSAFRNELDGLAHGAGKSAGGILGKRAAQALTPDNQNAELYDPAVFRRSGKKPSVRLWLRAVWRKTLTCFRGRP